MMNGYWFGPMGWIAMIIGLLFTVLVIVAVIWLVVWAVRRTTHNNYTSTSSAIQSPKDIAQNRYARGEITREQYQQILEDLGR